jgi:hypothetical protein
MSEGGIITMSGEGRDDIGANPPVDGCDGFSGLIREYLGLKWNQA